MNPRAYYNEIDPFAADWLRNLIAAGHIAPGEVDTRSIEDVHPADLVGFTQCHFFAGIGIWSYSLRCAGWPDDRPVWTGSCPCQPFSSAGQGLGVADERHLWPAWFHLIERAKGREVPIYGEQVASPDGLAWLDIVQADLEGTGYTVRPFDICAAGVGSPHIRQRLYFDARWLDLAGGEGSQGFRGHGDHRDEPGRLGTGPDGSTAQAGGAHVMADAGRLGGELGGIGGQLRSPSAGDSRADGERERLRDTADDRGTDGIVAEPGRDELGGRDTVRRADGEPDGEARADKAEGGGGGMQAGQRSGNDAAVRGAGGGVVNTDGEGSGAGLCDREPGRVGGLQPSDPSRDVELADTAGDPSAEHEHQPREGSRRRSPAVDAADRGGVGDGSERPGPTNGRWRAVDWIFCRDGKWRALEPGTFPLADGTAGSVGRMQPRLDAMGIDPRAARRILGRRASTLATAGRNRVGRIRGFGNGIVSDCAIEFITATMND